jgi:hypothetical protein
MGSKTFGVGQYGILSFCKAKPENRGTGNCPHGEHIELDDEQLASGYVRKHNEAAVLANLDKDDVDMAMLAKKKKPAKQIHFTHSPEELESASDEVAQEFLSRDFDALARFSKSYETVLAHQVADEAMSASERLASFLQSENELAVELRTYLGEDADLQSISTMLVDEVGAMTTSFSWHANRKVSLARAVLSRLHNDMDKQNYVSTVLFFRGRCCYCDKPLSKEPKHQYQPSGEHLTPILPDDEKDVVGSTRYGNMALACTKCNKERGNRELSTWINSTNCIRKVNKADVLGRIKAFRKFADYRDYSLEESTRIRASIAKLQGELDKLRAGGAPIARADETRIRDLLRSEVEALRS